MGLTQISDEKAGPPDGRPVRALAGRGLAGRMAGWGFVLRGGPLIALLLMILYLSFASPHFATLNNVKNLGQQNAYLAILAVGQTMVIVGAGIDLSVGAVMAVSASLASVIATQQVAILGMTFGPINIWPAMAIGLAVGALAGFVNGLIITKGRIPDFIATLGMMETARGVALLITGGLPVPSYAPGTAKSLATLPEEFIWLGGKTIFGGIPTGAIIAVLIVFAGWVVMTQTGLGRSIYAVGGNKEAARVSGIDVDRTKILTYTLMGLLAGVAGMVLVGRMASANALMGSGDELKCIAAVVIGGTNMFGGAGSVVGTLIGSIIMGVLGNGLNLLNVSAFWQRVLMGVVIVLVVLFDQWRRRKFGA
jgi:ribose/xylose/arabinose/galactoside ABC-type transport system permease subunit